MESVSDCVRWDDKYKCSEWNLMTKSEEIIDNTQGKKILYSDAWLDFSAALKNVA